MDEKTLQEIAQKHQQADSFISLFFTGIDVIYFILILIFLGCGFKNFCSTKQQLSQIILVDVLLRIYSIYFNTFEYNLTNEIILSLFATVQFYLFNSIFKKAFRDEYYDGRESLEIKSPLLFSVIFYPLVFTFDISKYFSLCQYIIGILAVLAYSYYIQTRIFLFLQNLEKKHDSASGKNLMINIPYFIAIYLAIYFIIKIGCLYVQNRLYCSYILMACDIFKEVGKYLSFGVMIFFVKSFNKYIKDEETEIPVEKRKDDFEY